MLILQIIPCDIIIVNFFLNLFEICYFIEKYQEIYKII